MAKIAKFRGAISTFLFSINSPAKSRLKIQNLMAEASAHRNYLSIATKFEGFGAQIAEKCPLLWRVSKIQNLTFYTPFAQNTLTVKTSIIGMGGLGN